MINSQTIGARAHRALWPLLAITASVAALQRRPYGTPGGGGTPPARHEEDDDERARSFEALLGRKDNAEAAARELFQDNFKLRHNNRQLKDENTNLRTQIPAEGSVVLDKTQAADWAEYQKHGKPSEVAKKITEGGAAIEATAKRGRADALKDAATGLKWNPEVLTQLAEMHGLELISQTVDPGNGAAKITTHSVKNAQGVQTELQAYAQQNWQNFLPALTAQPAAGGTGGAPPAGGQPPAGGGTQWLSGGGVTGNGGGAPPAGGQDYATMADDVMKHRQGGPPNPLERAAQGVPAAQPGGRPGGPGAPPPGGAATQ